MGVTGATSVSAIGSSGCIAVEEGGGISVGSFSVRVGSMRSDVISFCLKTMPPSGGPTTVVAVRATKPATRSVKSARSAVMMGIIDNIVSVFPGIDN